MLRYPRKTYGQPLTSPPVFTQRRTVGLLLATIGVFGHAAASADPTDTFQPFASVGYSHEDNLFLLPDDAPGFVGQRGDSSRQTMAGFLLFEQVGRQVFNVSTRVSRVNYDHYDELDYTGKDFSGDWEWHLANHLEGHIGGTYGQSLTSFADFHGQERSLRVDNKVYANGVWRFHPSWRLRTGVTQEKFNYDLDVQKVNDRRENTSELGVDYLSASDSSVGLVLRHLDGIYPNPLRYAGIVLEDGYQQDEIKANVDWKFGGVTQLQFLGGWARRQHKSAEYRDSSGLDGRATVFWTPVGKLHFSLVGWRQFAALESLIATSTRNKGVSASATYDATSKLRLQAIHRVEDRKFSQVPGLPFLGDGTDVTHVSSVSAIYTPWRAVQLNVEGRHEQRSALQLAGSGGYRANSLNVSLVAQF